MSPLLKTFGSQKNSLSGSVTPLHRITTFSHFLFSLKFSLFPLTPFSPPNFPHFPLKLPYTLNLHYLPIISIPYPHPTLFSELPFPYHSTTTIPSPIPTTILPIVYSLSITLLSHILFLPLPSSTLPLLPISPPNLPTSTYHYPIISSTIHIPYSYLISPFYPYPILKIFLQGIIYNPI